MDQVKTQFSVRPAGADAYATRDTASWLLLLGLATLAPLAYFDWIYRGSDLPKAALIQCGALLLLSLWFLQAALSGKFAVLRSGLTLPFAGALLWGLISLLWTRNTYDAVLLLAHWFACACVFFLSLPILSSERRSHAVLHAINLSIALVSLLGILQYLFDVQWVTQNQPPASTFGNRNLAAQTLVLAHPLGYYLLCRSRRPAVQAMVAGSIAVQLAFLYYTATRGAWVAFGFEMFLFLAYALYVRLRLHRRIAIPPGRLLYLAMAIILAVGMARTEPVVRGSGWSAGDSTERAIGALNYALGMATRDDLKMEGTGTGSIAKRIVLWRSTWHLMKEHPVRGTGLDQLRVDLPRIAAERSIGGPGRAEAKIWKRAHNDLFQFTAELGLIGLAFLLWALGVLAGYGRRMLHPDTAPGVRFLGSTLLIAISGIGLNAMFSFPFYNAVPPFFCAIFLSLLSCLATGGKTIPDTIPSGRRHRILGVCGLLVSLSATVLWTAAHYRLVKADSHYARMYRNVIQDRIDRALRHSSKVVEYDPYRYDIHHMAGQLRLSLGDIEGALTSFSNHVDHLPNNARSLLFLGRCLQLLERFEEAEEALEKARFLASYEPRVHDLLARVQSRLGRDREALEAHRNAVSLDPGNHAYLFNLGMKALQMKRYPEAVEALEATLRVRENWDRAHLVLGELLFTALARQEEGIRHLKRALELNPRIEQSAMLRNRIENYEKKQE